MNKRTFDKLCRLHFGKLKKGEARPTEVERHAMLLWVVRHNGPIHASLLTPLLDRRWLACMGYLYETKEFVHKGEHVIKEGSFVWKILYN